MNELNICERDLPSRTGSKSAPLREHLVLELSAGRLKPGSRLPSENQFASNFKISRPTVRRALAELEREGLIRREPGRGTFVREKSKKDGSPAGRTLDAQGSDQNEMQKSDAFVLLMLETRVGGLPVVRGFERATKALHRHMIVCDSENDPNVQANIIMSLLRKDIAGVAMMPTTAPSTPAYQISPLQHRGIPVVFCHRGVQGIRAPVLALDYGEVGRLLGDALIEQGHRRVALFHPHRTGEMEAVVRNLRVALEAGGGELPDKFIHCEESPLRDYAKDIAEQEETLLDTLRCMCSEEDRPTAIVAIPDMLGELIYMLLLRLGIRMPQDISLVSRGDVHREGPIARRLAAVVFDEGEMARQAVDLLQQMQSGSRPIESDETIPMPPGFYKGESLGPVPRNLVLSSLSGLSDVTQDTPLEAD